jgi:pilus assembly protein CpaE
MAKGKIISIFSAKGGVGKTILSLNLAGVISNKEKKVLLIDLDLYNGGIAVALNKEVNKTIYNFCDDYSNNRYNNMEDYVTNYNNYIDYLACPKDPRQANKIDYKYLDILLDKCSFIYDYVIIDMTHILDEINVRILDKVDHIFFLLSNNMLDIKSLRNVLTIFKDNEIKKYKIILNEATSFNNYFSLFDLKNILNDNIDYTLSSKYFIDNIGSYLYSGEIYTLKNKTFADYKILELIIDNISKDGETK